MRIEATCDACGRDFLLAQVATAAPLDQDRCPKCGQHLHVTGARQLADDLERSFDRFVRDLTALREAQPRFRLRGETIWRPLRDAAEGVATLDGERARG